MNYITSCGHNIGALNIGITYGILFTWEGKYLLTMWEGIHFYLGFLILLEYQFKILCTITYWQFTEQLYCCIKMILNGVLSGFTMANYSLFLVFFIRLEFRSICDSWISVDLSVFRLFHLQYVIIFDSQILQVWEGERYLPQSVTHSR